MRNFFIKIKDGMTFATRKIADQKKRSLEILLFSPILFYPSPEKPDTF